MNLENAIAKINRADVPLRHSVTIIPSTAFPAVWTSFLVPSCPVTVLPWLHGLLEDTQLQIFDLRSSD